jgi:hypothetical protein
VIIAAELGKIEIYVLFFGLYLLFHLSLESPTGSASFPPIPDKHSPLLFDYGSSPIRALYGAIHLCGLNRRLYITPWSRRKAQNGKNQGYVATICWFRASHAELSSETGTSTGFGWFAGKWPR